MKRVLDPSLLWGVQVKAVLLSLAMLACSSAQEPTATQTEHWFNTCNIQPQDHDLETCSTFVHFTCKDGDSQFLWVPAEGATWLGTQCITTPEQTYVYVCVYDSTTGWADVRCSN